MNKRQRKKRYKRTKTSAVLRQKNYIYDLLAHLEEHAAILNGVGTAQLTPVALEVKE